MFDAFSHPTRRALAGLTVAAAVAVSALPGLAQSAAPLNKTAAGIAMDGFDVVSYFTDGAPALGLPENAVAYDGAQWLFATPEHAADFRADPSKFAPRNNGWCAYAVSEGYGAEVDFVNGWAVIDGVLYLNWNREVRDTFVAEKDKRIPAQTANWPKVSAGLADKTVDFYPHSSDPSVNISHPQALD